MRGRSLVDLLLGRPLRSSDEHAEQVGPLAGIPILGLDALASAAYGPEAALTVLLPLGVLGLAHIVPITVLIIAILLLLFFSYRQTIDAYPNGGGSYTVAKQNLGENASLLAAAALSVDYLLNVAVAISAGVGALVSAVPALLPETLWLCLGVLTLLTLVNLRGVRAAGLAFMAPAYLFVACLVTVIAIGAFRTLTHGGHPSAVGPPPTLPISVSGASAWLLLRAFASGCTAMTGVEAVSNGVPIFRPPRTVLARRTLSAIVAMLVVLLVGVGLLSRVYHITATPPGQVGYQSVLSQITAAVVGRGVFYDVTMGAVMTVLALSANTSFADFPRVWRLLALDRYLPVAFAHRGRRLAFSHGVYVLTALSALLLIAFRGITDALIPLFAAGAFLAFTLSQAGMVVHWRRKGGKHARVALIANGLGAAATAATFVIILAAKFTEGAWITVLLVGGMIAIFKVVRRYYTRLDAALALRAPVDFSPLRAPIVIVPLWGLDLAAQAALRFAFNLSAEVYAAHVHTGEADSADPPDAWSELVEAPARAKGLPAPKLVVIRSEYRELLAPLARYVRETARAHPDRQIAVVMPELVEGGWFRYFLHDYTASVLRALLLLRCGPSVVVVTTPWHLRPERASQR